MTKSLVPRIRRIAISSYFEAKYSSFACKPFGGVCIWQIFGNLDLSGLILLSNIVLPDHKGIYEDCMCHQPVSCGVPPPCPSSGLGNVLQTLLLVLWPSISTLKPHPRHATFTPSLPCPNVLLVEQVLVLSWKATICSL